jgi:hypothetical protein
MRERAFARLLRLAEDPTLIAFELWDGTRAVAEERRRERTLGDLSPPSKDQRKVVNRRAALLDIY